jgi:hypothetical protein
LKGSKPSMKLSSGQATGWRLQIIDTLIGQTDTLFAFLDTLRFLMPALENFSFISTYRT